MVHNFFSVYKVNSIDSDDFADMNPWAPVNQLTFACSKSTIETVEKGVEYV